MSIDMTSFGITTAYRSASRTLTHGFNAVGNVASALDATSQSVEASAWMSLVKTASDFCEEYGIKDNEGKSLSPADAVKAQQIALKEVRGY